MKKAIFGILLFLGVLTGCTTNENLDKSSSSNIGTSFIPSLNDEYYRGFSIDNVLYSDTLGDIHYNVMVPDSYDGSKPYALYFSLPGYAGLYQFGAGINLHQENFVFEAQKYISDMIIVTPQLSDWGDRSANQTLELVHYFLNNYNIDEERIYANGYSGVGETMSRVLGKEPSLFTAYLHCSSTWDGDLETLAGARVPVYLVIGENDEFYGSRSTIETYDELVSIYEKYGLSEEEIENILVLDVKDHSYFSSQGIEYEHGGGNLFARDESIMGWLFSKERN